jgi:CRP-like cAMP-binding protein
MIEAGINYRSNLVLNALPSEEYESLTPRLEYVELPLGKVLYDLEEPITHAYFPLSGTVSIVTVLRDGGSVEAAVIGNEGVLGIPLVLGTERASNQRAQVQIAGSALKIRSALFIDEFKRREHLRSLLLNFLHAFITQISQTVACNGTHRIEDRLARWLLSCHDRIGSYGLELTQEFIAQMLGVRRAGVSVAITGLQKRGLIKHKRGHIQILDRAGLEAASCECYEVVRQEYERLFKSSATIS